MKPFVLKPKPARVPPTEEEQIEQMLTIYGQDRVHAFMENERETAAKRSQPQDAGSRNQGKARWIQTPQDGFVERECNGKTIAIKVPTLSSGQCFSKPAQDKQEEDRYAEGVTQAILKRLQTEHALRGKELAGLKELHHKTETELAQLAGVSAENTSALRARNKEYADLTTERNSLAQRFGDVEKEKNSLAASLQIEMTENANLRTQVASLKGELRDMQVSSSSAMQGLIEEKRKLVVDLEDVAESKVLAARLSEKNIAMLQSELVRYRQEIASFEEHAAESDRRCSEVKNELASVLSAAESANVSLRQEQSITADTRVKLMASQDTSIVMFLSGFAVSQCEPIQKAMDWFIDLFTEGLEEHSPARRPVIIRQLKRMLALSKPLNPEYAYDSSAPLIANGILNARVIPNDIGKASLTQLVKNAGLNIKTINSYAYSVAMVIFRLDSISNGIRRLNGLIVENQYIDWFIEQNRMETGEAELYMGISSILHAQDNIPAAGGSDSVVSGDISPAAAGPAPEPRATEFGAAAVVTVPVLAVDEPITVVVIGQAQPASAQPASVAGHSEVAAIEAGLAGLTVSGGAA